MIARSLPMTAKAVLGCLGCLIMASSVASAQPSSQDEYPPAQVLVASTAAIPMMPALPLVRSVAISAPWAKHPVRMFAMAGVAIVATLTAAGGYHVIVGDEDFLMDVDLDATLMGQGEKPQFRGKPPTDPLMFPPFFNPLEQELLPQKQEAKRPQNLAEKVNVLEEEVLKAQNQKEIMDRIFALSLALYAHKNGITVEEIPKEERMRLESEQNTELVLKHLEELSDVSIDGLLSRIHRLEASLLEVQKSAPADGTLFVWQGKAFKRSHLNRLWQAIGAGVLFVMFF